MGAVDFLTVSSGKTAKKAFALAREDAEYEHGHGGYTGSIAEKDGFITFEVPEGVDPYDHAIFILDHDNRIDDKWGPAGCIKLEEGRYLFFGMASS